MPVAVYRRGPDKVGPKSFPAPKRASLAAWYNAARKVIPDLPRVPVDGLRSSVDEEVICIHGYDWDLFIARKAGNGL